MDKRISNLAQVASIRRYRLMGGKADGIEVLDCDNGRIRFLLNVSKACDLMQLYHEGQNVSFLSRNGFVKRETSFLNRFEGGMVYTCGLDSVGGREGYELHGSLHHIGAEIVRAECNEEGIVVEAVLRDTALFGKNLVLRRRIVSPIGAEQVSVEDTLINESFREEEYCLLYHVNVGYPMLDAGAQVEADVEACVPRTEWSRVNEDSMYEMTLPEDNREECCYFLKLREPKVSLVNRTIGKRFTLTYSAETLPHFVEWKSMASGDYALGLEPCTTELDDRFEYRRIKPGEAIAFRISLNVRREA